MATCIELLADKYPNTDGDAKGNLALTSSIKFRAVGREQLLMISGSAHASVPTTDIMVILGFDVTIEGEVIEPPIKIFTHESRVLRFHVALTPIQRRLKLKDGKDYILTMTPLTMTPGSQPETRCDKNDIFSIHLLCLP